MRDQGRRRIHGQRANGAIGRARRRLWRRALIGLVAAAIASAAACERSAAPVAGVGSRVVPAGVRALREIEFGRIGDRPLRLDLYRPAAASR